MLDRRTLLLSALALLVIGFASGLVVAGRHYARKADSTQQQADEYHGRALAEAARADELKRQADTLVEQLKTKSTVSQAAGDASAKALSKLPSVENLPIVPPASMGPDLVLAVQALSKENAALKDELAATKFQASLKSAEADAWHKAYLNAEKEAQLQRIAGEAEVKRERVNGWLRTGAAAVVAFGIGKATR